MTGPLYIFILAQDYTTYLGSQRQTLQTIDLLNMTREYLQLTLHICSCLSVTSLSITYGSDFISVLIPRKSVAEIDWCFGGCNSIRPRLVSIFSFRAYAVGVLCTTFPGQYYISWCTAIGCCCEQGDWHWLCGMTKLVLQFLGPVPACHVSQYLV